MNTVIVASSSLLPYSETFVAEQARALRRWRPVLVGAQRAAGGLALDGFEVRLLAPPGALHSWGRRACRLLGLPYPVSLLRLRAIGARLMHVHFGTNAVDLWPLARALKLPMLVTLHGYDINVRREWWEAGHGGPLRRRYPRQLARLAAVPNVRFLAVSEAIRERATRAGIPSDKVRVCPIGIDPDRFAPSGPPMAERRKRVLFVGRLIENKGVGVLIEALAAARADHPDAELVVVGDGPLRGALAAQARALGVPARFAGARDAAGVREELAGARLLCLPSLTVASGASEGFGLVLLEAQACGVPVLTSSRGGSRDGLAEGITGHAFGEGDVAALAVHLRRLLGDAARLEQMARAGPPFVREHFDLHRLTARLECEYDEVAG